ncbi:MAG: heme-binding domain-containing protein [Flavisolibacter sp.]
MKKVLLGILVLLIIAQFIQPSRNEGSATSANDITHTLKVPDTIMRILQTSCYDCHSDKTNYPWYSRITPVNWWLKNHVDDGKKGLNFSVFNNYSFKRKDHKLEEIAEIVGEHEMPLESYLWIHKEAKLDDVQRKALIDWAKLSRQQVMQDSLEQKDVSDAKL